MEASTGILTRWWAPDDVGDVRPRACARRSSALERAGKTPEDIDLIIVGTDSPDYITPATSVIVQDKLGAKNAGTFDVGCACASFPTAFASAAGMMATNPNLKTVLVIGVYMMHKLADADDPMVFFYGDGAGAAILERERAAAASSPPRSAPTAPTRRTGRSTPAARPSRRRESRCSNGRTPVKMYERYPPEINNEGWPRLVRAGREERRLRRQRHRFPHLHPGAQADHRAGDGRPRPADVRRRTRSWRQWGYTGSACIPMALDDALQEKKIKPGDLVVLVGSGVGYNQAAAAFRVAEDGARLFVK